MTNENNANEPLYDHQLDALLRDIDIPADLKEDLRAIPQTVPQTAHLNEAAKAPAQWPLSSILSLAAIFLAIGAFFAWPLIVGSGDQNTKPSEIAGKTQPQTVPQTQPEPNSDSTSPNSNSKSGTSQLLAQTNDSAEAINAALHEIEMRKLRKRLARIEQSTTTPSLDPREYNSLITAIADQTILQLGGSEESVQQDMARVIKTYPNTVGAAIAQEFLDSRTN